MARRISKILLMGSIAPVLTFTPPHAFAQSGTGGSETDNARSSAPEASRSAEIIVTARRREESLQTVPVAVAVVGAETIAAQGIQTTGDIQKLVPGVKNGSAEWRERVWPYVEISVVSRSLKKK